MTTTSMGNESLLAIEQEKHKTCIRKPEHQQEGTVPTKIREETAAQVEGVFEVKYSHENKIEWNCFVDGIKLNDPEVLEKFYQEAKPLIENIVRSFLSKGGYDIEGVTHEIIMKIYERIGSFRGGNFFGWFYKLTMNKCLNHIRDIKRRREQTEKSYAQGNTSEALTAEVLTAEDRILKSEKRNIIMEHISQLSDTHKQILLLFYFNNLTHQQISEELDIAKGTVMSRLFRARNALKKLILEDPRMENR